MHYAFFYFQTSQVFEYFESELTGSTIRNLSLKSIRELPIPIPPVKVQEQIANILSTQQKKISLYNQLLEKESKQMKGLPQKLFNYKSNS